MITVAEVIKQEQERRRQEDIFKKCQLAYLYGKRQKAKPYVFFLGWMTGAILTELVMYVLEKNQ